MRIEVLKNIAEIIAGQSPPSDTYNKSGDGIPFFQGMADYGERSPVIRNWCRQPTKISLPNDILISVRAPVGPVNINNVEACIGRGLSAIRAGKEYSYEYIFYFLKANEKQIAKLGVGSTFTAITQKDLGNLKILVPETLAEQIKIAIVLSKAEALIKHRKENIDLLDEFLRCTFLKMFGDPVKNEQDWQKVELKHFGEIITGNTPARSNKKNYSSNFIEWVKTDNITSENTFITKAFEYLSEEGTKNARTVDKGALLVACIAGSIESIGRAALSNRTVSFNQQINAIQPNEDVSPFYLYWLFKISKKYIQNHATKGMKRILTKGEFEKIKLIKPLIEEQNKFAAVAESVEVLKEQLKSGLNDLENLYASLSQKSFKGDLEINVQNIIDSIEEELALMEYGGSIGAQGLSNSTDENEALLWRKELEAHKNDIRQKELIISILKGDTTEISNLDKEVLQKEDKTKSKKSKHEEDKRYGDPFEVDEVTAKKQGETFYKEWKKLHPQKTKSKVTWDKVSSQQVAEWIKEKYEGHHFSNEMLIRFLKDEYVLFPDYYSSEELKKYPQLNGADDLKSFIFSAVTNENPFIKLEQHFYNAEKETFQLNVTEEDYKLIESREPKERSGIYFSIVER